MPSITIPVRVRGLWRVRLSLALLFAMRACGIIRSNDHAVDIAERWAMRQLRFEMKTGRAWAPIRMRRKNA